MLSLLNSYWLVIGSPKIMKLLQTVSDVLSEQIFSVGSPHFLDPAMS